MKLYGERGINPLGGCLPIFVQLPIFIVLYQTVKQFEHLESFRTGGLFWFQDLTIADPYFLLPVAYVLTMMASQELSIRRTAPQQQQLMRFLPTAFGIFLFRFPAGLFVYWVTSNVITFCQNLIIYRASLKRTDQNSGTPADEDRDTGKADKLETTRRKKKKVKKRR